MPPVKRPPTAFVAFSKEIQERRKASSGPPLPLKDTLMESSAAWKLLSTADKEVSILL